MRGGDDRERSLAHRREVRLPAYNRKHRRSGDMREKGLQTGERTSVNIFCTISVPRMLYVVCKRCEAAIHGSHSRETSTNASRIRLMTNKILRARSFRFILSENTTGDKPSIEPDKQ